MKAMLKSEIARAAGVSEVTLRRWLSVHEEKLRGMGVRKKAKLLSPKVVRWVCEEYGINESELRGG